MTFPVGIVFLSLCTAVAHTFPHSAFYNTVKRTRVDLESSGVGPDEPVRGIVKVVQLDPGAGLAHSGSFTRGLAPRRAPMSHGSGRSSFPAFLSRGRPAPAPGPKGAVRNPLLHQLHPKSNSELKKRQGMHMWQRALNKGERKSPAQPIHLKDTKQTCTAVPFNQHVTADGCDTVTVHNKLCFGQCSSLFVPSEGEFSGPGAGPGMGAPHRRAPCSRCAPSRARTVAVPLHCGAQLRVKRVMVVEECRCETGREEKSAEAATSAHM